MNCIGQLAQEKLRAASWHTFSVKAYLCFLRDKYHKAKAIYKHILHDSMFLEMQGIIFFIV